MSSEDNINASLELLLDTICNTFGGVLFISMLVVIMTNLTSQQVMLTAPDAAAQSQLVQAERELEAHRKQLNTLREALEQQADIAQRVASPDARELLKQLRDLKRQRSELTENRSQSLADAGKSQADVNEIARQLQELDAAMAAAKAALSAAELRLNAEITARSRAARLPKLRETSKVEIAFFLKQGRLTAYVRRGADGGLTVNAADFVETTAEGQRLIEPKPGAGLAVTAQADAQNAIARLFSDFDATKHYLAIFVWPDSFDQFATVKDAMVARQFEYRLVLIPRDKKVPIGATGGKTLVQ